MQSPIDWPPNRVRIVIVGPEEDTVAHRLMKHMKPMCSEYGFCAMWHPSQLPVGSDEASEVISRVDTADIIILLMSPSTPLELQENLCSRKTTLVPIIVKSVDMTTGPLAGRTTLPRYKPSAGPRTLATCRDLDEVMVEIINELRALAERHKEAAKLRSAPTPARPTSDVGAFVDAVCAAFNQYSLNEVTYFDFGTRLDHIVAPGGLRAQVTDLYTWLDSRGNVNKFVVAARQRNPGNDLLRAYAESRYGRLPVNVNT